MTLLLIVTVFHIGTAVLQVSLFYVRSCIYILAYSLGSSLGNAIRTLVLWLGGQLGLFATSFIWWVELFTSALVYVFDIIFVHLGEAIINPVDSSSCFIRFVHVLVWSFDCKFRGLSDYSVGDLAVKALLVLLVIGGVRVLSAGCATIRLHRLSSVILLTGVINCYRLVLLFSLYCVVAKEVVSWWVGCIYYGESYPYYWHPPMESITWWHPPIEVEWQHGLGNTNPSTKEYKLPAYTPLIESKPEVLVPKEIYLDKSSVPSKVEVPEIISRRYIVDGKWQYNMYVIPPIKEGDHKPVISVVTTSDVPSKRLLWLAFLKEHKLGTEYVDTLIKVKADLKVLAGRNDWRGVSRGILHMQRSLAGRLAAVEHVFISGASGTTGVDNVELVSLDEEVLFSLLWSYVEKLSSVVSGHEYTSIALHRLYIPKPNGKLRPLSVPTIYDRMVQSLYLMGFVIRSEFQADSTSFGYRPKISREMAVYQLLLHTHSASHLLNTDIKSFFDDISHKWIIDNLLVSKSQLANLLRVKIKYKGRISSCTSGVPQGGVTSPTLSNIVLDGLQFYISQFGCNVVRYADDVIITGIESDCIRARTGFESFLKLRGLTLSADKTHLVSIIAIGSSFSYLGFQFVRVGDGLGMNGSNFDVFPGVGKWTTVLGKVEGFLIHHKDGTIPQKHGRKFVEKGIFTVESCVVGINRLISGWANSTSYVNCEGHRKLLDDGVSDLLVKYQIDIVNANEVIVVSMDCMLWTYDREEYCENGKWITRWVKRRIDKNTIVKRLNFTKNKQAKKQF